MGSLNYESQTLTEENKRDILQERIYEKYFVNRVKLSGLLKNTPPNF